MYRLSLNKLPYKSGRWAQSTLQATREQRIIFTVMVEISIDKQNETWNDLISLMRSLIFFGKFLHAPFFQSKQIDFWCFSNVWRSLNFRVFSAALSSCYSNRFFTWLAGRGWLDLCCVYLFFVSLSEKWINESNQWELFLSCSIKRSTQKLSSR